MRFRQPSPQLVAALATLTAILATGVAGFLLEQNLALQKLLAEPPVRVQQPLQPPAPPTLTPPSSALDTPTWQTYTNAEHGFSLLVPPLVSESTRGPGVIEGGGFDIVYSVVDVPADRKTITANIINKPDSQFSDAKAIKSAANAYLKAADDAGILLSYEKLESASLCGETDSCPKVSNYHFSNINNHTTLFLEDPAYGELISIATPGKLYRFWSFNDKPVFEKILSTFKLLNQVDTSTWQTYRNEQYGFEFKYPSNLFVVTHTVAWAKLLIIVDGSPKLPEGTDKPPVFSVAIPNTVEVSTIEKGIKIYDKSELVLNGYNVTRYTPVLLSGVDYNTLGLMRGYPLIYMFHGARSAIQFVFESQSVQSDQVLSTFKFTN